MNSHRFLRRFVVLCFCTLFCVGNFAVFSQTTATNFNFQVNDAAGLPVKDAKICMWDRNQGWSSWLYQAGPVLTDSTGKVTVHLPNIYSSANSTSNPSPNIGYLVIPPEGAELTWKTGETLYYNLFGVETTATEEIKVSLSRGYKVVIQPKLDGVAGIRQGGHVQVALNNTPSAFRVLKYIYPANLSSGTFEILWPENQYCELYLPGDGQRDNYSVSSYYDAMYSGFTADSEGKVHVFNHVKQPKGLININQADNIGGILYRNWDYHTWSGYGSASVYLPYGNYNLRYVPYKVNSTDEVKPAILLFGYKQIASVPLNIEVNINDGAVTTAEVALGLEGDIAGNPAAFPANSTYVQISKKVDQNWFQYEQTSIDAYGKAKIPSKLASGTYRLRVGGPTYKLSNFYVPQGVVDLIDNVYKCYSYDQEVEFTVESGQTTCVVAKKLPQKPAFMAVLKDGLNQPLSINPVLGTLRSDDYGSQVYQYAYRYDNVSGILFYPFASSSDKLLVRADLPPLGEEPSCTKIFAPITINASGTTVLTENLIINRSDFVKISGNVLFNGKPFDGNGRLIMNPLVPGSNIAWNRVSGNVLVKEFVADPGYDFCAEKGQKVLLQVERSDSVSGYWPLKSFVPYSNVIDIGSSDFTHDIELDIGGYFVGKVLNNGQSLPASTSVGISVFDTRTGRILKGNTSITDPGMFEVSGLETGNYQLEIDINGINLLPENQRFYSQLMPLLQRIVYVDKAKPASGTIEFNLEPKGIGMLNARILDDTGYGLEGLEVYIRRGSESSYDSQYNFQNPVFYCHTDVDGNVVTAAATSPANIPLEAGYYHIFARLPQTATTTLLVDKVTSREFKADIDFGYRQLGSIKISAGVYTSFEHKLNRLYRITGQIFDNSIPLAYKNFYLFNEDSGNTLSSLYTTSSGTFEIFLKDGNKQLFGWVGDIASGTNAVMNGLSKDVMAGRLYIEPFNVGNDYPASLSINLNPQNLKEYKVSTIKDDGLSMPNVYVNLNLSFLADKNNSNSYSQMVVGGLYAGSSSAMIFYLPDPASLPAIVTKMQFVPNLFQETVPAKYPDGTLVYDQNNKPVNVTRMLFPPAAVEVPLIASEVIEIVYKTPKKVVAQVRNIPAGVDTTKLVALLRPKGEEVGSYGNIISTDPYYPQYYYYGYEATAPLKDGQFVFDNVRPGITNVLEIVESFNKIPDYLLYSYGPYNYGYPYYPPYYYYYGERPFASMFRHVTDSFVVASQSLILDVQMPPLAELTIKTDPEGVASATYYGFGIHFSDNRTKTSGSRLFQAINTYGILDNIVSSLTVSVASITYPVLLPASYSYSVFYQGGFFDGSHYDYKSDENVFLPSTGLTHTMRLRKLYKFSGQIGSASDSIPYGTIWLCPPGVNPMTALSGSQIIWNYNQLIDVYVNQGRFERPVPAGKYIGMFYSDYAATRFFEVDVNATDTLCNFDVTPGVRVAGKIQVPDGASPAGFSLAVFRKASAKSLLYDGAMFYPYPTYYGSYIVPCGQNGEFSFRAETGVDYYLQPIVPKGFRPGLPGRLALTQEIENILIPVGEALGIKGVINVPAKIIARPLAVNPIHAQIGEITELTAETVRNEDGKYEYLLTGLASMPYNLEVVPIEPGLAGKKFDRVQPVSMSSSDTFNVDLLPGFRLIGRIVDENTLPVNCASVSVNLAMVLKDNTLLGLWAKTDAEGRYVFENVPEFISAFVRTDKGFASGDKFLGNSRTKVFVPQFSEADRSMSVDLILPYAGRLAGKLIDEAGLPVSGATVTVLSGVTKIETVSSTDGSFMFEGIKPAADWVLEVMAAGKAKTSRNNILVTTAALADIGAVMLPAAVMVKGKIFDLENIVVDNFPYGLPEEVSFKPVSVNGNRIIPDIQLLNGTYLQFLNGMADMTLPSVAEGESVASFPFYMWTKPGRSHIGMLLSKKEQAGFQTLVTWGWQQGIIIPTPEQLAFDAFPLVKEIVTPLKFGYISGTLRHAIEKDLVFQPEDAAILFYPVDSTGVMQAWPLPAGITHPETGKWAIENIPWGSYRVKVITRKHGSHVWSSVVKIATDPVNLDLVVGALSRKIAGRVMSNAVPVSGARVKMVINNFTTTTDADGNYEFNLPVGEFFIPQIEFSKAGMKTRRLGEFAGIATAGVKIGLNDLALGDIDLSSDVSVFEGVVLDKITGRPAVGAEVSLVYQESASPVWTVGEVCFADGDGRVVFASVPKTETQLRVKMNGYRPKFFSIPAASHTAGILRGQIDLEENQPRVFFTGQLQAGNVAGQLYLESSFDFNRVVEMSLVGYKIDGVDRSNELTFPDAFNGRITSMKFAGNIPDRESVIATVTYNSEFVGLFELVGGSVFRKEFEVDPLSSDGFTAKLVDSDGNQSHAGLTAPPGFLDPTIETFELVVQNPEDVKIAEDRLEGTNTVPEFAGMAFEFVFGGANFAAGSEHKALFEVTLPYTPGQQLEPRWYDPDNKRWSKVGIIDESLKWDHPAAGFVTFKVSHLTRFAILKNVTDSTSGMRCDFNNDQVVDLNDVVYMLAYTQLSADKRTAANVKTRAQAILNGVTGEVVYLPGAEDDLNVDGKVDLDDVVMALAWTQLSNDKRTEANVSTRSQTILSSVAGSPTLLPGAKVTR